MNHSPGKRILYICLFLIAATAAVYWQVWNCHFILFDDPEYVYENIHVASGLSFANMVWAFTSTHAHNWHPLTWISHMLDVQLFGLKPGWHHLVNVFFHIVNTVLLFLILNRMTRALWPSAFVAALFALHPLHVESVAWVAERKDVLSTFFWMLTMGAYVFYVEKPDTKRYLITLGLFALGLMAKPMLVTLPFVLLLLDYWPLERFQTAPSVADDPVSKKDSKKKKHKTHTAPKEEIRPKKSVKIFPRWALLKEKIPFLALSALSSIITIHAQKDIVKSLESFPVESRIANAIVSYVTYIRKAFWPIDLSIFYPYPVVSPAWWQIAGAFLLLGIVTLFTVYLLRKPYLIFGWFWYLGTLFPVIGLVQVGTQALADRYTYIPFIGLFVMIAWGIPDITGRRPYRKKIFTASAAVILSVLMITTWKQVACWRSNVTLFQHAVAVTSNNYWAHYNLGLSLLAQGEVDRAYEHFQKTLRIRPNDHEALNNIGLILAKRGDLEGAINQFTRTLIIRPDYVKGHINLGNVFSHRGMNDDAVYHFKEALRIDPDNPDAHYALGVTLARTNHPDEAIAHLSESLRINPHLAEAHNQLGIMLARKGLLNEAIGHFHAALQIKPDLKAAQINLQLALHQKRNQPNE